jgi:hypothetical protein
MVDDVAAIWAGTPRIGRKAASGELLIGNGQDFKLSTLTAGTGISIVNVPAGSITISTSGAPSSPYYGSFISSVAQTNTGATAPRLMYFDATPVAANAVTLASNGTNLSRITVANAGVYNIMFSAQIYTSSGGSQSAFIWLRINGTDVPVVPMTAGQYAEIVWESADANLLLAYTASPTYGPAIPSVIATINAVG